MKDYRQTQNTPGEQNEGWTTWTVAEILDRYNAGTFGIPHFQRGLVWDDAMLGALLESLYFDTPCGAIVLWKPDREQLDNHGLSIGPRATDREAQYLLVDGQQRIRSLGKVSGLLRAFRNHGGDEAPVPSCGDGQRDESTGEPQVLCINLARTHQFEHLISQVRELPLFSFRADRGHPHYAHSQLPHNFIPMRELAIFKNLESWTRRETYLSENLRSREQVGAELLDLRETLGNILERKFFVRILQRENFSEVVRVYNRINSAGKRVESEERALATLSVLDRKTNRRLQEMFTAVHGRDSNSDDALHERDELLKRQRERTLGFKFLMRAFVQACAQHSQLSADAASLSFDAIDRDSFRKAFAEADGGHRAKVWDSAMRVVACVARVLRNELCCDDFRFVPDAASLIPVTQLLIRFPKLAGAPSVLSSQPHDAVVAALIFRVFLEEPRDPYKVAEDVRRSNRPLTEIVKMVRKKLRDGRPEATFEWLKARLKQSNSVQDRYVLLLYWLIRRNEAKDFSYKNLSDERCKGLPLGKEREVKRSEEPEKQHIIPLSKIAPNLEDSHNRARQGPAHNIGNLTYISSALNSLDCLSDQLIDPSHDDDNNLRAHMLRAEGEDDPLEAYKEVKKLLEPNNPDGKAAESQFRLFCDKRRTVIARAFLKWLDDLETSARSVDLGGARPVVPALVGRLDLADTIRSRIREKESPDYQLEDLLLRLVESIEQGVGQRRLTVRRAPLKGQNQSADRFAVDARRVDAGDGEHGKKRSQRILVLYVDSIGMKIELLNVRMRPAFEDLLKLLGQSAGSKEARVGIDEARRVSADDIATQFALLLNGPHLHAKDRDSGA